MSGGSLIYLEKIYIGNRLRSVDTLASTIVMGTDNGSILVLAPNQIEPKGTFPINDYDWPLCALKGKDESCNAYKK